VTDVVDKATRSRMMAGIRGKDTRPELQVRKALHALGFRYRLHAGDLPGRPDLVFPKYGAIIEVHGCFWHKHDCHIFKWPKSRTAFWKEKINGNADRDVANAQKLADLGWRVLTVWECSLRGKTRLPFSDVLEDIRFWLMRGKVSREIRGRSSIDP
jgi:DNA mismatch endonuclease, patch repair protein